MKLVLFSDLHLDSAFAWLGRGDVARRRREALRQTLLRIVELTRSESAEALLCAGDLYEHERFTPDTAEFLRQTFMSLYPIRVFLAPGNHDWYGPESLYRRVDWSDNVHVFDTPHFCPVTLGEGVTLWGAAHCVSAGTGDFLENFRARGAGLHLALFHGSERSGLREQGDGKLPHAPFDADAIEAAGLHHAFVGHYHTPRDAARYTYAGNPEPLAFGETGPRGAVVIHVRQDGSVGRDRRVVTQTSVHEILVDLTGCGNRNQVQERVAAAVQGKTGLARITLAGELEEAIDLLPADIVAAADGLEAVSVRSGDLRVGYDLDALARLPDVRGQFVRDVLGADMASEERRRVILTGLRALERRTDLEVV
jgi:DNA repair exonuclease SbcCD nuclease subunit